MTDTWLCWRCGNTLTDVLEPLPRATECPQCRAQLHVCRMCQYFDPAAGQQCREPIAEFVRDKDRANFCGYFRIRPDAYVPADKSADSRQQLDALFGLDPDSAAEPGPSSAADSARQQLEDLFKK